MSLIRRTRGSSAGTARGFSLIEVMVAMAIGTLAMIGAMQLIGYAIHRGAEGRQLTVARQLAGALLEGLRNELRYDPASSSAAVADPGDVWKADVLPHEVKDAAASAAAPAGDVSCQPAGKDDGVTYHYGPFSYAREGNTFYACYALRQAAAADPKGNDRVGVPTGSAEAIIRVLWRDARGGWATWSVGDLLLRGT